jgi:hypothetical protein
MISMGGSWEITGRLVEEEKRFIGGGGLEKGQLLDCRGTKFGEEVERG